MAPSNASPQNSAHPPQREAASPPKILIRPPTLLDLAQTTPQGRPGARGDVESQLEKEDQSDSDASTNSASTGSDSQPVPGLQLPGRVTPTDHATETDPDGLPIINDVGWKLASLLRAHHIKTQDVDGAGFWTLKLLRHILSRERVRAQLEKDRRSNKLKTRNKTIEQLVDAIHPQQDPPPDSDDDKKHFLRIYALLILCEQSHEIERFIRKRQSDRTLPIKVAVENDQVVVICENQRPEITWSCFKNFGDRDKEYIQTNQRRFLTPYFDLDSHNRSVHRKFPDGTILPWCQQADRPMRSSTPSVREGGYGFVSKVKIHPTSHGFHRVLQIIHLNNELFALKTLRNVVKKADSEEKALEKQKAFDNELQNLQRFSGLVHGHLVTLLATFELGGEHYFLFPCAECSLEEYWEDHKSEWKFDISTVRWVSKQIAGIMAAIDTIHEPRHTHLQTPDEKRYGRHGDIKPDNILWFRSSDDPRGILVVSDMGLTSFNRDISRSNIPGEKIPGVPNYRPPECEVVGGKMNRSFDIWTLGCLFLELITWLLGGWDLLDKFQKYRLTLYINGTNRNVFHDIREYKMADGNIGNVALVKEEVLRVSLLTNLSCHSSRNAN